MQNVRDWVWTNSIIQTQNGNISVIFALRKTQMNNLPIYVLLSTNQIARMENDGMGTNYEQNLMCKYCCKNAIRIFIAKFVWTLLFSIYASCIVHISIFSIPISQLYCVVLSQMLCLFYSFWHLFFFIACSKRWMSRYERSHKIYILKRIKTRLLLSIFSIWFALFTGWIRAFLSHIFDAFMMNDNTTRTFY